MRTKSIGLALLLAVSLIFAACQSTPEEQIVVEKDTERLVEQITEDKSMEASNDLELPDGHYKWEATGADGNLSINVDAKVSAPADKLPTARVKGVGFDQATVTKLFNYLFPEEKPYIITTDMPIRTKDEIQDEILIIKKHISEKSTEEYEMMSEEEALETIKQLENELKSAPDSIPSEDAPVESDGTMFPTKTGIYDVSGLIQEEKVLRLDASNDTATIYVQTPSAENSGEMSYFGYHSSDNYEYNYVVAEVDNDSYDFPKEAAEKLKISFEEAKDICDEFLAAGGIKDMQLSRAYISCDGYINMPEGPVINEEPEHYCYDLYYTRTINNVSVANLTDLYGVAYVDAEESELESKSLPWENEMLSLRVDERGLIGVMWYDPTKTEEIITDETELLSFNEASEIFEKMIINKYEPKTQAYTYDDTTSISIEININDIRLELVRIRTQNAVGREGIYVPAWVFYGKKVSVQKNDNESTLILYNNAIPDSGDDKPLMIINAVDGSIIDPARGY